MKKETTTTPQITYTGEISNTPLRFLWYISKPHSLWGASAFLTMFFAQVAGVIGFYVISRFVDVFNATDVKEEQINVLVFWGGVFFLITVFERLLWRASGFLGIKWLVDMHTTGYQKLYDYVTLHSHTFFTSRFAGALSNKISNAVDGSTRLSERFLWGWAPEFVGLAASVVLFWSVHWSFAIVTLAVVFLLTLFNLWFVKIRRPYVVAYSKASSRVRGEGVDLITNVSAMRQFSARTVELERLSQTIYDRATKDKFQWFLGEWLMVVNTIVGIVYTGVILYGVYYFFQNDIITVGTVVLVVTLLLRVGFLLAFLGNMLNGFIKMYGEVEEGLEGVLIDHEIIDAPNAQHLAPTGGEIAWHNVTFTYGANTVFEDFSLTIPAGQRVGLVGPSGAGKSTFVSLLLRQHDLDGGAITIDGQDIASVTQDSLREAIAVVPQEPMLFHRSIRENIAYGKPDATDEEIIAVAKKAQAHDFVTQLEEGYDTLVGERGVKLSGGQKQRIAIARAMLKDAPILILDEATSALDSESEVLIQKALHELMAGKTVIAVAHRLSTLREMDRIIVLEGGRAVEDGPHHKLAKAGGTYAKLWEHQAGGFISG